MASFFAGSDSPFRKETLTESFWIYRPHLFATSHKNKGLCCIFPSSMLSSCIRIICILTKFVLTMGPNSEDSAVAATTLKSFYIASSSARGKVSQTNFFSAQRKSFLVCSYFPSLAFSLISLQRLLHAYFLGYTRHVSAIFCYSCLLDLLDIISSKYRYANFY